MKLIDANGIRAVGLTIGEYRLDFRTESQKAWLSRESGEAMETTSDALSRALIAALDDFWYKEF